MSSNGIAHQEQVRITLRPIGSGLPIGFFAFGIGMLLLAGSAIGWIPALEQKNVGMFLIAFVFPLELLATIFAFLARDTLGATTLGLFATSWLSLGWADLASPPGQKSVTLAIYLFGFGTAVLLIALMATRSKPFFTALLTLACARMVLDGYYEIGSGHGWSKASGICGIGLSALSMYGGTALALEDARQRELLPLFRRGAADQAFHGYEQQLERLEAEPGVRQQL
jgi:succinate-acetate transporter protein